MHLYIAYCNKYKIIKFQNHCVILFGFRKGKTGFLCCRLRAISSFLINLLNTRGKNALYIFIVDRGLRDSSLPSLARVMLHLVRVGVTCVSWALRYLEKP